MSRLYESQQALERAAETLQESEYNLEGGFPIASANRAYYAVFYCLTALLHTEDVYTKRHRVRMENSMNYSLELIDFRQKQRNGPSLRSNSVRQEIMI